MSLQEQQTELDETRPDRLASAILIIGICIVCLFAPYAIIVWVVGAWQRLPLVPPSIFLGVIFIVYGWFRTVRGSVHTKQYVKATLIKMRNGAIAGSVTALVVIAIAQVFIGIGFNIVAFVFIAIPGGLFFGISPGGISGLILGRIWKNNQAAFVGGAITGGITSFLYVLNYIRSL